MDVNKRITASTTEERREMIETMLAAAYGHTAALGYYNVSPRTKDVAVLWCEIVRTELAVAAALMDYESVAQPHKAEEGG